MKMCNQSVDKILEASILKKTRFHNMYRIEKLLLEGRIWSNQKEEECPWLLIVIQVKIIYYSTIYDILKTTIYLL